MIYDWANGMPFWALLMELLRKSQVSLQITDMKDLQSNLATTWRELLENGVSAEGSRTGRQRGDILMASFRLPNPSFSLIQLHLQASCLVDKNIFFPFPHRLTCVGFLSCATRAEI